MKKLKIKACDYNRRLFYIKSNGTKVNAKAYVPLAKVVAKNGYDIKEQLNLAALFL